jgi:serine phosphatase RsbU (regulator of sigma subunit)
VLPATAPSVLDTLGDAALLLGAAGLASHALRLARERLLWRVRQQLILSYVFIGVVPALLLVAFFLLAGVLLFANIGSYLIQSRVRTLVDEIRVAADEAGRALEAAASTDAAREAVTRVVADRSGEYPGLSVEILPAPARCTGGDASGRQAEALVAGAWMHVEAPVALPDWVPCEGYASLVANWGDRPRPSTSTPAVRAVTPARTATGPVILIMDVPLGDGLLRRLGEETGTQIGEVAVLPAGDAPTPPGPTPTTAPTRLTDVLRWVAFLDYSDWASGDRAAMGLAIGLNMSRLYARISATPLASLGNFSFGQILLAGLFFVGGLFLVIQSVAFVMGFVLARSITGSVHALFEGTERVRAGDFTHTIPVQRRDQLGELAESFNTMTASIVTLLQEREEKQRMEQELAVARRIQMSLLPQAPLRLPGLIVAGHCEPAREVGGDYYDFLPLGPTRAGVLVADVAGKGTSAALYMAELKGVIHSLSRTAGSPRDLLIEANRIIGPHLDDRSFITMTYAVVDSEARTFTCARAGHCPLVHVRGAGGGADGPRASVVAPSGMVLGLKVDDGTMFAHVLEEVTLPLGDDDVLVLFTDGISEAMNPEGECFGEGRLVEAIEMLDGADVDELREAILGEIARFASGAPQHDDMTMLVLKVGGAR